MRNPQGPRGFSLIEAMISMSVLAIGILGVAQVQGVASSQNGMGRRASTAGTIARDFVETVLRWEYGDPRLNTPGCGANVSTGLDVEEGAIGSAEAPAFLFDYTATSASSGSSQGATTDGLLLGGTQRYLGSPKMVDLVGGAGDERYQLLWNVRELANPFEETSNSGCRQKRVLVVVRYPTIGGLFRSITTTVFIYNRIASLTSPIREIL